MRDWRRRWTSQATRMNADGVMIVLGPYTMTRLIDGAYRESCDPVYDAWLQSAFTDVLKTMEAFGPVWLVLPPYDRVYNAERSFEDRDAHTDCTISDFRAAAAAAAPNTGHRRPPRLRLSERTELCRGSQRRPAASGRTSTSKVRVLTSLLAGSWTRSVVDRVDGGG